MTPSAGQVAAFQANGGFAPSAVSTVVLSLRLAEPGWLGSQGDWILR